MKGLFQWILDALIKIVFWLLEQIAGVGDTIISKFLANLTLVVDPSTINEFSEYLAYADYFIPLREAVGFGAALFALWLVVWLYRLVKSWIPTLAGT